MQKQLKGFFIITIAFFLVVAFCIARPSEIMEGMRLIIISRDALITDYFELAGYGAAFFNSAMVMSLILLIIHILDIPCSGLTIAAFFINAGFALFGKNPINIIPIILGTYLYAKLHNVSIKRYVYTALFGTCLAPIVTEIVYLLPFGSFINLILALLIGILIGFILPPLAMHTASMHMGYNLFNVGFAAGIVGFIIVSTLKSFGFTSETAFIWCYETPLWLIIIFYGYFFTTFLYGLGLCKGKFKPYFHILRHPGRAVADFILMDGLGSTLMNMATIGIFGVTYILLIGGNLSGPVIGTILSIFGFAAFGVHLKNFIPCILGVYLAAQLKIFDPTMPAIQLAALFSAGLAPIAGQFGPIAGILAGMLHTSIVMSTNSMYAGLNLYNNGFAAGFVAIIMVPVLDALAKHPKAVAKSEAKLAAAEEKKRTHKVTPASANTTSS